jgi:hypothetical protein
LPTDICASKVAVAATFAAAVAVAGEDKPVRPAGLQIRQESGAGAAGHYGFACNRACALPASARRHSIKSRHPRHRVSPSASDDRRGSSTPRPLDSITGVSEYWIARLRGR